jgi:transcriptional regulator with XRE-family HTH domain
MYNTAVNNNLSTWLIDKFREWEHATGRKQSVMEFARYLDVTQPSLTRWMAGDHPPTGKNIRKLADKLGPEIYYLLGFPHRQMQKNTHGPSEISKKKELLDLDGFSSSPLYHAK